MGSRYMGYPSPRGVHVPETYADNDDNDPYRRDSAHSPRRNRYSRSVHQTPRIRDVTWITSPDPTPQTPHAPPTPWLPPPQVPSSPAYRPPSVVPPSPAPTVGEHMAVDDVVLTPDGRLMDPYMDPHMYQPQRQGGGVGVIKSIWKGLKKLSGFQSSPYMPRTSTYGNQTMEMPAEPRLSSPSEATQYGNPTPPRTDEHHSATPYTSPYVRPTSFGATPAAAPHSLRASPVLVPSQYRNPTPPEADEHSATPYTSPYVRPTSFGATPAVVPHSLRASSVRVPSMEIPPPITVVSPSISPSPPLNSIRSVRMPSPAMSAPQNLSARGRESVVPPAEDGSQTLHEPFPNPVRPPHFSAFAPPVDEPIFPTSSGALALDSPSPSKGSLSSTMARFRRRITELDDLPWVSDSQIADEYIPERNPRSQMRRRVRQGAEPSWYNSKPEVLEQPEYWSEWDMWAKQSTGALWDGVDWDGRAVRWGGADGPGQWGTMYPYGYVPAQPGFAHPLRYPPPGVVSNQLHAPVLP